MKNKLNFKSTCCPASNWPHIRRPSHRDSHPWTQTLCNSCKWLRTKTTHRHLAYSATDHLQRALQLKSSSQLLLHCSVELGHEVLSSHVTVHSHTFWVLHALWSHDPYSRQVGENRCGIITLVLLPSGIVPWPPAQLWPLQVKHLLHTLEVCRPLLGSFSHMEQESMVEYGAHERHIKIVDCTGAKLINVRTQALIWWGKVHWHQLEWGSELHVVWSIFTVISVGGSKWSSDMCSLGNLREEFWGQWVCSSEERISWGCMWTSYCPGCWHQRNGSGRRQQGMATLPVFWASEETPWWTPNKGLRQTLQCPGSLDWKWTHCIPFLRLESFPGIDTEIGPRWVEHMAGGQMPHNEVEGREREMWTWGSVLLGLKIECL